MSEQKSISGPLKQTCHFEVIISTLGSNSRYYNLPLLLRFVEESSRCHQRGKKTSEALPLRSYVVSSSNTTFVVSPLFTEVVEAPREC